MTLASPSYDETLGTQVYEQRDGRIRSALLAVPMRFVACGEVLPGRLLGVFMTDADKEAAGAAQLILALRPRRADFAFCDSASPTSRDHLLAIGGKPIPAQNLEWTRSFRPAGALAGRFAERFLRGKRLGLHVLVRPLDGLLRRLRPEQAPEEPGMSVVEMSVPDFLVHAPRLIAHYAVRPLWNEAELSWLVSLAAQNTWLGALTIRAVVDRPGATIGCFVYYAAPGRAAHVLNVLALSGREPAVLGAMFRHLDDTGHVEARGRAQPALMAGLSLQRWLLFRHRAFALVLTRVPEINDAVARGDVYVGGLAGEDWSRLLCDFH
ncbi:GNAT family N-acetyltransferase [Bosea sp. NPDC055332]